MTIGKTIIIFGATSSIARATIPLLTEAGHHLILVGRNLETTRGLAEAHGAHGIQLQSDNWQGVRDAVEAAADAAGGLDGVVNCIGSLSLKPIHLLGEETFSRILNENLGLSAAILASTVPHLRKSKSKDRSVVMISSVAAGTGLPNHEAIAAAKAGLEGMMRSAAATYAGDGIRFNTVAPSLVHTNMTHRICTSTATRERLEKNHPLGRIGDPTDIAGAISWLLDENASWITGQTLHVDGGLSRLQTTI